MIAVLRDDGEGNIFYRIDRRVPGIVRIVEAAGMKGLASTVLMVEKESMHSKFQDIPTIVKQMRKHGQVKAIALLTRPTQAAKTACTPSGLR